MEKPILLPDSPSFVDICTLHQHADHMRYYRLWIYACNTVLCCSTLVFSLFAFSVFVDPKISLLSGVEYWQPTFLYAYVALVFQCGILQTIGCLGAIRLNQRLLNTYWYLLLILMIGDIIVGLVWVFRLDKIKSTLRPTLRQRLIDEYGTDPRFTQVWDWVQKNEQCCGVDGAIDYLHINESGSDYSELNGYSHEVTPTTTFSTFAKLPATCCTFTHRNSHDPDGDEGDPSARGSSSSSYEYSEETQNKRFKQNHNYSNRRNPYRHSGHNNRVNPLPSDSGPGDPFHGSYGLPPGGLPPPLQQQQYPPGAQQFHQGPRRRVKPKAPAPTGRGPPPNIPGLHTIGGVHFLQTTTESSSSFSNSVCELPAQFLVDNSLSAEPMRPPHSPSGSAFSEEESSSSSSHTSSSTSEIPHQHLSILMSLTVQKHSEGCAEKVLDWVNHVTDVLFVIGFCIIVFLKGCFLGILRYEIKEMIQKIRLLNGEATTTLGPHQMELLGLTSMTMYGTEEGDPNNPGGEGGGLGDGEAGGGCRGEDGKNGPNLNSVVIGSDGKPHYGNHVGNNTGAPRPIPPHRIEIDDDFDSTSTLLRRVSTKKKKDKPPPVPKNGNNNNSNNPSSGQPGNNQSTPPNPATATSTH